MTLFLHGETAPAGYPSPPDAALFRQRDLGFSTDSGKSAAELERLKRPGARRLVLATANGWGLLTDRHRGPGFVGRQPGAGGSAPGAGVASGGYRQAGHTGRRIVSGDTSTCNTPLTRPTAGCRLSTWPTPIFDGATWCPSRRGWSYAKRHLPATWLPSTTWPMPAAGSACSTSRQIRGDIALPGIGSAPR